MATAHSIEITPVVRGWIESADPDMVEVQVELLLSDGTSLGTQLIPVAKADLQGDD